MITWHDQPSEKCTLYLRGGFLTGSALHAERAFTGGIDTG